MMADVVYPEHPAPKVPEALGDPNLS
jgi:hypothetical protein